MILLKILLILGLVALNALFVTAEYALLSVRKTRLEELAREGNQNARLVGSILADVGTLFSGIQLGITVASLLMGWIGESMMAEAIEVALRDSLSRFARLTVAHSVSVAAAFLLITILLMVLGELVPKAVAYHRAELCALVVARPLFVFLQLAHYPVRALDGMARLVLRRLGQMPGRQVPAHTPDEVKLIVAAMRRRGMLGEEQEEMVRSVFDLHRARVREIMVPWTRITAFPYSKDLRALLDRIVTDQHSRVPIYEGTPDQVIGILYTKDLLGKLLGRLENGIPLDAPIDLRSMLHHPIIVPETMALDALLQEARRQHSQMALVVDEFGTYVGLVTIEDVLEQIVGEIQDEYDREEAAVRKVGENVLVVDASVSLRELAGDYDIVLPRDAGYETLAGFVLARLGIIPRGGESFIFEGARYTVAEVESRRVSKVRIEKLASASPPLGVAATPPSTSSSG